MGHPPRIPVWLRWNQEVVYFLIFCVARRKEVLANQAAFAAFESAITRLANWKVIAAVLMPDHIHLLIAPNDREAAVGNASGAIKRLDASNVSRGVAVAAGQFRLIASLR